MLNRTFYSACEINGLKTIIVTTLKANDCSWLCFNSSSALPPKLLPYHVTQISVAGVSPGRERPNQLLGSCGKGRGSAAILVRMML